MSRGRGAFRGADPPRQCVYATRYAAARETNARLAKSLTEARRKLRRSRRQAKRRARERDRIAAALEATREDVDRLTRELLGACSQVATLRAELLRPGIASPGDRVVPSFK